MPRDIPVGNGTFLIAFNKMYEISDIYYPHVGMENHCSGNSFRFGVWVDGEFSWVRNGDWSRHLDYDDDALVTAVSLANRRIGLELHCADCVDFHENVFLRHIKIMNTRDSRRTARLFFHHDFNLADTDIGDTAFYDPRTNSLIHYKRQRYFLISSCTETMCGGFQYATGLKGSPQWEGTWRDAEDGTLSGNPIVQGSVDSVMGIECVVEARGETSVYYWVAAAPSYDEARVINSIVHERSPERLIKRTRDYWRLWVNKEEFDLSILPAGVRRLYKRSLLILRSQIDNDGAIIAANDTDIFQFGRDTYSYMWPRDGALVAHALDLAGYSEPARRFYNFCGAVMRDRGYFLHKYHPDGSPGSSWHPWVQDQGMQLPIQEDETALVIWALWRHFEKYRDVEFVKPLYKPLIKTAADFMLQYRERETGLPYPSYDLWEERLGISSFTTASVIAGLRAAANFSGAFGETDKVTAYAGGAKEIEQAMAEHLYSERVRRFLKMLSPTTNGFANDDSIDASLFGVFYFGVFEPDDPRVIGTMQAIREKLWVRTDVGGIARYEGDSYQRVSDDHEEVPGNPWFVCTLWMAQHEIARAKTAEGLDAPLRLIEWVAKHALPSGVLAEQVHPYTGEPVSVSPLSWSHATFVLAVLEYLRKMEELTATHAGHEHYILERFARDIVSKIDASEQSAKSPEVPD